MMDDRLFIIPIIMGNGTHVNQSNISCVSIINERIFGKVTDINSIYIMIMSPIIENRDNLCKKKRKKT